MATDLPAATRARLDAYAQRDDREGWLNVAPSDLRALLAAYDALRAERDHLAISVEAVIADRATAERERDAIRAERAQAAPVLAAADQWVEEGCWSEAENDLRDAVLDWRAAREESNA